MHRLFQRLVLTRLWLTFVVLGLSLLVFGAGTLNFGLQLMANLRLLGDYGWRAAGDGALRQLLELTLTGYASVAAYIVFKTCEHRLSHWLGHESRSQPEPTKEPAMSYIDGFVTPVQNANREAYLEHAQKTSALFKEHGATRVVECWGDDVPEGKLTSSPMAVKREPNESVVFSWITWPSREARDEAWKKLMADPRMQPGDTAMPFDGKRIIYGGFQVLLDV